MQIRHRLLFNKNLVSKDFIEYLKRENANIIDDGTDLLVAYIIEEKGRKEELQSILEREGIPSMIECIYTKLEMKQAEWFSIRSKFRWEYPQPEEFSEYKHLTYNNKDYCHSCGCGLKQQDLFQIKKAPIWGKRNFLMLNWVHDELFLSGIAKEIIQKSGIQGIKLLNVKQYEKDFIFDDIYQMYINNILEPGLIDKQNSVKLTIGCNNCGSTKYLYSGRGLSYRREIFDKIKSSDAVKSFETFGDGLACSRIIFISRKLYDLLLKNNLDKNLAFEPIKMD